MILTESEIWYTYSTYLVGGVNDLNAAAKLLVESGLAFCAMHRDGETYWKAKDGVRSGITNINVNGKGDHATIRLDPHESVEPDYADFAKEAWYQCARLRYAEIRLFGEDYSAPPPYVRAFLGECELIDSGEEVTRIMTCYPVVKLYESGVLIVEMRTILARPIEIVEFIEEYLNAHTRRFDVVGVPPALSRIAPRAYDSYAHPRRSMKSRVSVWALESGHDKAVDQLTEINESGDFAFESAPLPSSLTEGKQETLLSLVLTMFEAISFTISDPRKGLPLLFRGQRNLITRGGYWQARPHVHILRYEDQAKTVAENEARHRKDLNQIFLSTSEQPGRNAADELPDNARLFEDYGAYVAPQAIVWMWSEKGVDRERKWQDPNRGHLVYPNQACAEMLEYGYMVHRSLSESILSAATSRDVTKIRRTVLDLGSRLRQSSHFGEIAKLLENGWRAMRLDDLKRDIEEGLAIRESETRSSETRATETIGRMLTIVFGMVAIPTLAGEVVSPLWDLLGVWRPNNPNAAKLFMIGVATLPVVALIVGISRWYRNR
jgi:hypothetical protein